MTTRPNARQIISRDLLSQLVNQTGVELDDILRAIDSEVTPPLRMMPNSPLDRSVLVENIFVTNPATSIRRTIAPIDDLIPSFTSGSVLLPASSGGTITVTPGADEVLTLTSGFVKKIAVSLLATGDLQIYQGAEAATESAALVPSIADGVPLGYIVARNVGGVIQNITAADVVRFTASGSGGGGGVVKINYDDVTGVTGSTITFGKTFKYGKEALFFRNGVKMRKVTSFTPAADEYMEVDNGDLSTQITLGSGFEAEVEDVFEMYFVKNTFDGIGLAEKTIYRSRGYADGSQTQNCSIATVSAKTRVTISGYTLELGVNAGETIGNHKVEVNGQEIERKVTGVNDNVGNIVYEEVSGTVIDIYEITAGPATAELPADAEVRITQVSYFVAELDAITTDILPLDDDTYDLGSASRRWREVHVGPGSVHIGSAGRISFNESTQKLQFSNDDGTTNKDFGSGSGGDSTGDLLDTLARDEADILSTYIPNQIIDDFGDEDRGTKVNVSQGGSALRLSGSNLSGSYERTREASAILNSASAGVIGSFQQVAPKNTVVAANAFKIQGDLTDMFSNTKNVLIAKKVTSDGVTVFKFLLGLDGFPAKLAVSGAPSYNSGLDETTLTLANPDALDLDLDVSSGNYNTELRIIPFDYNFQVKTAAASAYEDMTIEDAFALPEVRIPGENHLTVPAGLTPWALSQSIAMSPNGQYGVIKVLDGSPAPNIWHFFWTADFGKTWTKYASTKSTNDGVNAGTTDEMNGNFDYNHNGTLVVANNGKAFMTYLVQNASSFWAVKAVYSDLTIGTPVITDTPDNTGGIGNYFGVGRVVSSSGETVRCSAIAADLTDLSYVSVICTGQSGACHGQDYTNGGASLAGIHGPTWANIQFDTIVGAYCTGTGVAHKVHFAMRHTDNICRYRRISQGTNAADANIALRASANGTTIAARGSGTNFYVATIADTGSAMEVSHISAIDTSPALSGAKDIYQGSAGITLASYVGWSDASGADNLNKTARHRLVVDPLDSNHVFLAAEVTHPDAIDRSFVAEMRFSDYTGVVLSQYAGATNVNLNNASSSQKIAQSFTLGGTTVVRTAAIKMFNVGSLPASATVTLDIYNVAGGVPTTLVASALESVRADQIGSSSNGSYAFFNFNNVSLAAGDYAIVLTPSYSTSGSNYLAVKAVTPSSMTGSHVNYNGSVWTADTSFDWTFYLSSMWISNAGDAQVAQFSFAKHDHYDQETQLEVIDNTTAQLTYTRTMVGSTNNNRPLAGQPFRRVLTMSASSTVRSSLSSKIVAGYAAANYDTNLIMGVSLGNANNQGKNVNTGVGNGLKNVDRTNFALPDFNSGTNNANFIADASFQDGVCYDFDGSTNQLFGFDVQYHNATFQIGAGIPFCIEAEIKPEATPNNWAIVNRYDGGAGNGWGFELNASAFLRFYIVNSGGSGSSSVASANALVNGTYYRVRATYDGSTNIKLWIATTPTGAFTEVASYSTQDTVSVTSNMTNTVPVRIGNSYNNGQRFNGRIGYVKMAQRSASFAYNGYKDQQALTSVQNIGRVILTKRRSGRNYATLNNTDQFMDFAVLSAYGNQASMVDSNDIALLLSRTIENTAGSTMHAKMSLGRTSIRDLSAIQGINVRYSR